MDPFTFEQLKEELQRIFPNEEMRKGAVEEAGLAKLVAMLLAGKEDDVASLVLLTEVVGDLARVEENRERLGAAEGLLERLVSNLKRTEDVTLQKWTARALGNLSYEHEVNIEKIISAGAVQRLIELMRSSDIDVKRNSTGALANLASADDHKEMIVAQGVIPVVYDVLRSSNNEVVQQMAGRVIVNLAENENNQVAMVKAGGLKLLTELLLKNEDENITLEAIEALASILEHRDFIDAFIKEGGLKALIPLISDESESTQAAAGGLVYALATQDHIKTWFLAEGLIAPILKLMHSEEPITRKNSIKIISQLVLNDEIANSLFRDVDQLLGLLQLDDVEILISATMIIGNLARSDEHCVKLVDAGVAQSLAKIVQHKDTRLQQLAAGALRNLSIPMQNKSKVGESGVFPGLVGCLSSTNAHAMFAAIGAIKTLLSLQENRQKFIEQGGTKALIKIKDAIIIDATQPTEEADPTKKPKDLRIQYEAARTLAIIAEEEQVRDEIVQEQGLGLLSFLFDSPFEILQNEGLRALKNLTTKDEHRAKLVEDGLLDILLSYLGKTRSEEMTLGLFDLLSSLADNAKYREQLAAKNADAVLADIANSPAQTEASHALRAKIGAPSSSS